MNSHKAPKAIRNGPQGYPPNHLPPNRLPTRRPLIRPPDPFPRPVSPPPTHRQQSSPIPTSPPTRISKATTEQRSFGEPPRQNFRTNILSGKSSRGNSGLGKNLRAEAPSNVLFVKISQHTVPKDKLSWKQFRNKKFVPIFFRNKPFVPKSNVLFLNFLGTKYCPEFFLT